MVWIAEITDVSTGKMVEAVVDQEEKSLVEKFPYWRAFFWRIGQGIYVGAINVAVLKLAKAGDFKLRILRKNKVVFQE